VSNQEGAPAGRGGPQVAAGLVSKRWGAGPLLARMAARYRRLWMEALGLSIASQLMALLFPIVMQVMVDRVLIRRAENAMGMLVAVLIAVAIFEGLFTLIRSHLLEHTAVRVHAELGSRVYQHLFSLPLIYFDRERMSDVTGKVRELGRLRRVLDGDSLGRVIDYGLSILLIGIMVFYSPLLTGILLSYIAVLSGVLLLTTPELKRRINRLSRSSAHNDGLIVESLSRIEAIKSTAIEGEVRSRLETSCVTDARSHLGLRTATNWFTFLNHVLMRGGTLLMLVVGGRLVLQGELTIGEFFAFQFIVLRLSQPMAFMIKSILDVQETRVSMQKLGDILTATPESAVGSGAGKEPRVQGEIALERVSFSYMEGGEPVLHGIDLRIPAGQVIAFIGPSGSGKTTLVKLALGLYRATSGRVLIDGVDVATLDAATLRAQVGVVQQDNPLFAMSVRDNIAISDPGLPLERIQAAAVLAGAHEFITRLPEGYDTIVGTYSARLSGGERQRIAIARALVTNPRVLVFDEATSALDFETEGIIQANMPDICAGRTVIIVSHRLSAIMQADRIVTLARGSIVEDGTHEQLLADGGWYAGLYRMQTGLKHRDLRAPHAVSLRR
jgi:subfamily B ATP-binding cassette protein HlyB/CyaB